MRREVFDAVCALTKMAIEADPVLVRLVMMNRLLMPNLKRLTPTQMTVKRKANKSKQKNRIRDWLRFLNFHGKSDKHEQTRLL